MIFALVTLMVLLEPTLGAYYEVEVKTSGSDIFAGTDADVFIIIYGDAGASTGEHELASSANDFETGSKRTYTFTDNIEVGNVIKIDLRRTDGGLAGNWKLYHIAVKHNSVLSTFYYNDWFSEGSETLKITGCSSGFKLVKRKGYSMCVDNNECDDSNICGRGTCVNLPGSYRCDCHPGYENKQGRCVDTNECNGQHGCAQHCVNTPGSYKCTCNVGFRLRAGRHCDNINECVENNPCVSPATCVDDPGSYHCNCPGGYRKTDKHTCHDINECSDQNACNYQVSDCVNYDGGYKCKCKPGFKSVSKYRCADVDECAKSNITNLSTCDTSMSSCVNLVGDYYCKCSLGYHQGNTNKKCIADVCGPLATPYGGAVGPARCQQSNANNFGDTCSYSCNQGYELADPNVRTMRCGRYGRWEGTRPQCNRVKCPALPSINQGALQPSSCGTTGGSYTGICSYMCNKGYQLSGNPQRQCQADRTWNGAAPTCTKVVEKPWISCPFDIMVDLLPGQKTADVSSKWKMPRSNMKQITVSPATATAQFPYPAGDTKVTWSVSNGGASDSCSILVIVNDKEKPTTVSCPADIHQTIKTNSMAVTWTEPRFSDNVGIDKVSKTHTSGAAFMEGVVRVSYRASDKAGNTAGCSFVVELKREGCKAIISPFNGKSNCNEFNKVQFCTITCPAGTVIYENTVQWSFWSCDTKVGTWNPTRKVPDCVAATEIPAASGSNPTCSGNRVVMKAMTNSGAKTFCAVCPTGMYKSGSACAQCPAGQYQDTHGNTACKMCPSGKSSDPGASKLDDCKIVCGPGQFSANGLHPNCQLCPMDTYQDSVKATSCKNCSQGTHTFNPGSSKLSDCGTTPVITRVTPVNQTIDEGQTVAMSCYVTGIPQPTIKWKFTKIIDASFLGRETQVTITDVSGKIIGRKLTITKATFHNNGRYECTAQNNFGTVRSSSNLIVNKVIPDVGSGSGSSDESEEFNLLL